MFISTRFSAFYWLLFYTLIFAACQPDSTNGASTKGSDSASAQSNRIWNTLEVFPGKSWEVHDPQSEGIDPIVLQEALDTLRQYCGEDGLDEVVVIRNGYLIHQGDSVNKAHEIYSCSKSFTGMAMGLLIQDRFCRLDDTAYHFSALLKQRYSGATLRHFATMTSGYNGLGKSRWEGSNSEDWSFTPYAPDVPLFAPGTAYCYWDEAQMMLGRILTRIAREDLHKMLSYRVFDVIQLGEWSWQEEGSFGTVPIRNGCTGVNMNALQLARVGWLYLNRGRWGSRQLIAPDWVEQSTQNQVAAQLLLANTDRKNIDGRGSYGFNWWVNGQPTNGAAAMPDTPAQTFYMSGFDNNMCFVVPEWNMVVIRMGLDGNPKQAKHLVYNKFFKTLKKGVKQTS
ncbi:MAG: serine hydrolase [Bacteroidota bacterium]